MDEVLELCRRVLGDEGRADEAAAVAGAASTATSDRIARLAAAARACRDRAEPENGGAPAPAPATEPRGLSEAVARELAAATARLPVRQREALALRELLRLSYTQIAQVMGLDLAAVAPLIARSRLRLRTERRGAAPDLTTGTCADHDRALRLLASRQDSEPISVEDDEWLRAHLAECPECEMVHAAMLEASVCYRAWP
jgi:hypothetical protein